MSLPRLLSFHGAWGNVTQILRRVRILNKRLKLHRLPNVFSRPWMELVRFLCCLYLAWRSFSRIKKILCESFECAFAWCCFGVWCNRWLMKRRWDRIGCVREARPPNSKTPESTEVTMVRGRSINLCKQHLITKIKCYACMPASDSFVL